MPDDLAAALAHMGTGTPFRASRSQPCASSYVCDDVEVGDRVVHLPGPTGVVVVCEGCADRMSAADELEAIGGEPAAATSIAAAEQALRTEFTALRGQYRPESVTALLDLLDGAAEGVARVERERWGFALRRAALRALGLSEPARSGLRLAASMIENNREIP